MPDPFNPAGGKTYNLSGSISSTQTTIVLSSFLEPVTGVAYTMALLNTTIAFGTIAPKTTSSEFISFTGITQNANGTATLTGVTRGLAKKSPFTTDVAYKLPHAGASPFILSDMPQVFQEYVSLNNDVTVGGVKTFSSFPVTPSSAPTTDYQVANKKYVDDIAIAGSPNATTSVKGIVQLPTQAQVEAGTGTGSTGASLALTNDKYGARYYVGYAADAGVTDAYVITLSPVPTAYFTGMIVEFKAATANTGACSLNVNSLGVKNIFLAGGNPATGTIAANSFVLVQYDGTQFNILSVSDWISVGATAGKIAQRNTTGDLTVNTTPTASTDAASKAYVDSVGTPAYIKVQTNTISAVSLTNNTITKITEWTGLTGNTQTEYQIDVAYQTSGTLGSGGTFYLRLNDDSGGNYAHKNIYLNNVTVSVDSATGGNQIRLAGTATGAIIENALGTIKIKATSTSAGTTRGIESKVTSRAIGGANVFQENGAASWNDVTNQITSIQLYFIQDSGAGRTISGYAVLSRLNI